MAAFDGVGFADLISAAFLLAAMSDQTPQTPAKFKPARWAEKLLRHRRHNYAAFVAATSERVRRALAVYERQKREAAKSGGSAEA